VPEPRRWMRLFPDQYRHTYSRLRRNKTIRTE